MNDIELVRMIEKHVALLAKRPGMFVSETTLQNVAIHLNGYFQAILDTHKINFIHLWQYRIALKYDIWGTAWSWEGTIRNSVETDDEAIQLLPLLFSEFITEYIEDGASAIEKAHEQHFFSRTTANED